MKQSGILYSTEKHFVCRAKNGGFEVYRNGITHAVRCAQIGYKGDLGLQKARAEIERREAQ